MFLVLFERQIEWLLLVSVCVCVLEERNKARTRMNEGCFLL